MHWLKLSTAMAAFMTAPAFAADHNVCERLMEANLSGHYVITNAGTGKSSLIQLRRLGENAAYTISTFRFRMPETGVRELAVERQPVGWLVDDPYSPERRVNVMNLQREGESVSFRFEDFGDPTDFYFLARPEERADAVQGDILHPDQMALRFHHGIDHKVRLTRLHLDKAFEISISHFLKFVLANRLDMQNGKPNDLLIIVDLKSPASTEEAAQLLGTEFLYPFDDMSTQQQKFYRFAVPKGLYEFLEAAQAWTKRWEIAKIDALPMRLLNADYVRKVLDVGNLVEQKDPAPSSTPKSKLTLEDMVGTLAKGGKLPEDD